VGCQLTRFEHDSSVLITSHLTQRTSARSRSPSRQRLLHHRNSEEKLPGLPKSTARPSTHYSIPELPSDSSLLAHIVSTTPVPPLTFPIKLAPDIPPSIRNTTQPIARAHVRICALSGDDTFETQRYFGRRIIHRTCPISTNARGTSCALANRMAQREMVLEQRPLGVVREKLS
jgi:hypothetical protein